MKIQVFKIDLESESIVVEHAGAKKATLADLKGLLWELVFYQIIILNSTTDTEINTQSIYRLSLRSLWPWIYDQRWAAHE